MGSLTFTVNNVEILEAIAKIKGGYSALIDTVNDPGHARILASRRNLSEAERAYRNEQRRLAKQLNKPSMRPGPHIQGWNVANFLRTAGNDPFDYSDVVFNEVRSMMSELINDALQDAWRTNRPQKARIKQILEASAKELVDDVKTRIKKGNLGKNQSGYMWKKIKLYDSGKLNPMYGRPPPYGILSGRFYEGIRYAWFKGEYRQISGAGGAIR